MTTTFEDTMSSHEKTERPTLNDLGVPRFGRIEIDLSDRAKLPAISRELRHLSDVIEAVHVDIGLQDDAAMLLAYRKIRATSQKLRG